MVSKKISAVLVVASVAFGAGAAHAESFAVIGAIPATTLSAEQMKAVEGKNHVYRLIDEQLGVELPGDALLEADRTLGAAATTAAAPRPQNAGAGGSPTFVRSPSRDAAAFVNALGTPPTPTRQ